MGGQVLFGFVSVGAIASYKDLFRRGAGLLLMPVVLLLIFLLGGVAGAQGKVHCAKQTSGGKSYYVLQNAHTKLVLNASDLTLAALQVPGKENLVTKPGWALFRVGLVQEPNHWYETKQHWSICGLEAEKKYAKIIKSAESAALELHYDNCTASAAWKGVNVVVRISLGEDSKYTLWSMSIDGLGPLKLDEIRFPMLTGLASTKKGTQDTDYIVAPVFSGTKLANPRKTYGLAQGLTEYPGPGLSVQLMAYCDGVGEQGLMISTLDNIGYRKTYESLAGGHSFAWSVIHYPDGREKDGKWSTPYGTAIAAISGDWYDAAKIYRSWASKQNRWSPMLTRKGVPEWFKDLSVWYQGQDRNPSEELMAKHIERMKKIRERIGEDIGFHWYLWQKDKAHDYRYPDYFPSQPGFAEAIAELQKHGVHCMPYMNMRLFDSLTEMWTDEKAAQWAIPDANGNLYPGLINEQVEMYTMCAGTEYWRDKLVDIITRMFRDYGPEGVYLDELHTYAYLCYAKNHQHTGCGGTYLTQGFREVIERVRKEFPERELMLSGENISETYADIIDAQLVAHSDQNPDSIPLLQTVMKECTVEMGLAVNREEARNLDCFVARTAFALARGRQLGWIQLDQGDMMDDAHVQQIDFLRACAQARRSAKDYLLYGEFLRTPEISAGDPVNVKWFAGKPEIQLNPVLAEAYKSPSGDLGIVAVNITPEDTEATIKLNYKDWPITKGKAHKISIWQNGKWSAPKTTTLKDSLPLKTPTRQPVVVRIM